MKFRSVSKTVLAICLVVGGLFWALGSLFVTMYAAELIGANYADQAYSWTLHLAEEFQKNIERNIDASMPGSTAYFLNDTISSGSALGSVGYGHDSLLMPHTIRPKYSQAVAIYDSEGNLIMRQQNALRFSYYADEGEGEQLGLAVVLLDDQFPNRVPDSEGETFPTLTWSALSDYRSRFRCTGILQEDGIFLLQKLEAEQGDEWHPLFESYESVPRNAATVTLYTHDSYIHRISHQADPELDALMDYFIAGQLEGTLYSLGEHDRSSYRRFFYSMEEGYYLTATVEVSPLRSAFLALWPFYLATLVVIVLLCFGIHDLLLYYVERPLRKLNEAGGNRVYLPQAQYGWRDMEALFNQYNAHVGDVNTAQDEIARLQTALDYANDAEQRRRTLINNLAHELKTPLAIVHSYAEGLKEHIAEDRQEEYLDVLLSESEHMDDLVLEMLEFSRLEAGRVKLNRDVFPLAELVQETFARLSLAMAGKGLHFELQQHNDTRVVADRKRIAQVVENFASNAVKYCPAGGQITVRVTKSRQGARCEIENDGAPLSDEALEKVWDSFYRADASRHTEGTGLGLAIAKSVVELHSGRVDVRNTDTGVCFGFEV